MSGELFGLPASAVEKIRSLLAAHPRVDRAVIYGSRAKGNYKTGSDIDLALQGASLDTVDLLRIPDGLDELLLPWTFDVCLHHQLDHAELLDHIRRVGKVFYSRTPGSGFGGEA